MTFDFLKSAGEIVLFVGGIVGALAVVVGGIAYFIGTFRRGRFQAINEAAETWRAEAEAEKAAKVRALGDVEQARREIAHLSGQVKQLSEQNVQLRSLIMGEQLPNAMRAAFDGVVAQLASELDKAHKRNLDATLALLRAIESEYLEPLKEGLLGENGA